MFDKMKFQNTAISLIPGLEFGEWRNNNTSNEPHIGIYFQNVHGSILSLDEFSRFKDALVEIEDKMSVEFPFASIKFKYEPPDGGQYDPHVFIRFSKSESVTEDDIYQLNSHMRFVADNVFKAYWDAYDDRTEHKPAIRLREEDAKKR